MDRLTLHFSLVLIAILPILLTVDGHGAMVKPCIRGAANTNSIFNTIPRRDDLHDAVMKCKNMDVPDMDMDDCPHCANGGGKGAIILASNNNWIPYEPTDSAQVFKRVAGLCGDPMKGAHAGDHEAGGKFGWPKSPIVATYKQDSVVEFVVDLTTNHQGYFEFFICDVEKCGGDINEKCFNDGHCHKLMREKTPDCEAATSKHCSPVDPDYPGRWYIGCREGGHVGEHFVGGKYMRYHLPTGFNTKHAVLQFYWVTANSCNPPGFLNYFKNYPMDVWGKCGGDGGTIGGRNPSIAECGGEVFPEEFWNCADVAITSFGGQGTTPKTSAPITTAAPATVAPATTATPIATASDDDSVEQKELQNKKGTPSDNPARPSLEPDTMDLASPEPVPNKAVSPTTTPTPKVAATCAVSWEQCGGIFYKGPTNCCEKGFECLSNSIYYSQCHKIRK